MRAILSSGSLVPEPAPEPMHRPIVPTESDRSPEATESRPQKSTIPSESAHYRSQGAAAVAVEHRVPGLGHLLDHSLSTELLTREST